MRIDIATLFPDMCEAVLSESIVGRARKAGYIEAYCHNIRDYTLNKHKRVDDVPYGGGRGMVMQADPIYRCWEAVCAMSEEKPHAIYMSPKGETLTQQKAVELSKMPRLFLLCGHYEGIDERFIEQCVDEELSIGDFVLTGGELPALVITDAVSRMCEGVLKSSEGFMEESHYNGLLEHAQYTRPYEWMGRKVPDVLLSGHEKNIKDYRFQDSLQRTKAKRPDMYEKYIENNPFPDEKKGKKNVKK